MKKLCIAFILLLCISCFTAFAVTAFAQNDARKFATDATDAEQTFSTDYVLNGESGFCIEYDINETGIPVGATADEKRLNNSDYILFDFVDSANKGFSVKIYPCFDDETYSYNRMKADLFAVNAGKKEYLETVDTYEKVFSAVHTLSYAEYMGYPYVSVDGVFFVPDSKIDFGGDLALNVTLKSSERAEITLNGVKEGVIPVSGEWSTLGQTVITKLSDGTTEFNLKDKRVNQYNGQLTVMRENVVNIKGYDVTKPIVLEYSYDISKAMGVWYGVCLGRSAFGDLTRTVINGDGSFKKVISSDNMITSDGVMFQMGTSMVQSQVQNGIVNPYVSKQGVNGYTGVENLDRLVIEIGETSTKMTMNDMVIFDSLTTKRSDFADGKCYPYFHFIGSPANPYKENKIIIKGVNAPVAGEETVRVGKGDLGMASFSVDNYDDLNGELEVYFDSALTRKIDSSKYIYDTSAKTLNIYKNVFDDLELGLNKIYLKNDGGITEVTFRLVDSGIEIKEPVAVGKAKTSKNGKDLKIEINTFGADVSRFYGNGISKADYYYAEENGRQYIVVRANFKDNLAVGSHTFRLQTENVNGDVAEGTIEINMGKGSGCKGETQCVLPVTALACLFAIVITKKARGKRQ